MSEKEKAAQAIVDLFFEAGATVKREHYDKVVNLLDQNFISKEVVREEIEKLQKLIMESRFGEKDRDSTRSGGYITLNALKVSLKLSNTKE